jgi:hypothetical protein
MHQFTIIRTLDRSKLRSDMLRNILATRMAVSRAAPMRTKALAGLAGGLGGFVRCFTAPANNPPIPAHMHYDPSTHSPGASAA